MPPKEQDHWKREGSCAALAFLHQYGLNPYDDQDQRMCLEGVWIFGRAASIRMDALFLTRSFVIFT